MEIRILKSEIFREVEKRSSLEAANIDGRFESVWASQEDGHFLDTYWIEGCMAAVQVFKRYLTRNTVTHELTTYDADEVLTVTAQMPERYNSLLDGSVATDVKMMIAAHVMNGWMSVQSPELAKKYEDESVSYADDLRLKILYREEPTATMQEKEADDASIATDNSTFEAKGDETDFEKDTSTFEAKGADTTFDKDNSRLATKDAGTTRIDHQGEPLSTKPADDVAIAHGGNDGEMIHKGMDRIKLNQYECYDYFEQRRNHGRRNECGPCDRPTAIRPRPGREGC